MDTLEIIIIIISVLLITLTCNLPEWCDKIKLSNLPLPRKGGTVKSLQLLSTSGTLLGPKEKAPVAAKWAVPHLLGFGFGVQVRVQGLGFGI